MKWSTIKPISLVVAGCILAAGFAGLTAYADKEKEKDKDKGKTVTAYTYGTSAYRDVTQYGASPTHTPAENKQALQDAIAAVDSQGGGVIIVPYDIEYGYKRNTVSTHPDFSATDTDILVIDYSKGSTYAGSSNPLSRDGMQVRYFSSTSGNEPDGQHDGNTTWFMGNHHPALMLMHNNAAANNRQATVFFGNRGKVNWGIGQGNNAITGGTDDQLSNFKIVGNNINGGTGLTNMMTILKTNGYFGFNNSAPTKEFTFAGRQADTEFLIQQTKAGGDVYLILKTKTKERKFKLEDDNGDLVITKANSAGEAVRLSANGTGSFASGVSGGAFDSASRPDPAALPIGTMIFDTTLGKPLWSHNNQWKDANGAVQ
ncbi:hypothetical protein FE783_17460 [Paenibacillus mesophilus]|uniref:hypothetical protein n=1 Tax=Paenibacillus mesophilus TaxID=2582849 RepID=UPI00110D3A64|nr:hypothetical protein [Paenibacillus mesophilus]TMV48311.1 hypothetical protein FE783_17460 [Paenibacillus mesophilus]